MRRIALTRLIGAAPTGAAVVFRRLGRLAAGGGLVAGAAILAHMGPAACEVKLQSPIEVTSSGSGSTSEREHDDRAASTGTASSTSTSTTSRAAAGAVPKPKARTGPFAAIWVTRWDYKSPQDIHRIMEEAADLGMTDVLWQVRGQADAYYRSQLEPWGEDILLPGRTELSFDPLTLAVAEAHMRGLRLHAWVNVMPLWKGKNPPKSKQHLYYTHPDWKLMDQTGTPQPLTDHYVILNPALIQVQNHIVAVCRDIVDRYDVDGLHLDYVRFVGENLDDDKLYPGDKVSIAMYEATAKGAPTPTPQHQTEYRAWVRDRITRLVDRIKRDAVAKRPGVELSCAVWRRPDIARNEYLQDGVQWAQMGAVDRLIPMIYTASDDQFRSDLAAWRAAVGDKIITPGIGDYLHKDLRQTVRQIELANGMEGKQAKADGFAIFAYGSLFESVDPQQSKKPEDIEARRARLQVLEGYLKDRR